MLKSRMNQLSPEQFAKLTFQFKEIGEAVQKAVRALSDYMINSDISLLVSYELNGSPFGKTKRGFKKYVKAVNPRKKVSRQFFKTFKDI
jgi:hypothetical protein